MVGSVSEALQLALGDNLRHAINRTCVMSSTRLMTASITARVTSSVGETVTGELRGSMKHLTTHYVARPLIPLLAHSIATVVVHALTRKPE